jgi:murein DD-endopeptidase MepM/ murein hydrolase activator NlpD
VTKVVYSSYGYGYHVVISNGGGVETPTVTTADLRQTRDWVEQGQLIAQSGIPGGNRPSLPL